MPEDLGQLEINLQVDDDLSTYEFDELTAALQRELLQLDVDGVERVSAGPAPDGSRGVDLAALGALIVEVGKAGAGPWPGGRGDPGLGGAIAEANGQADDRRRHARARRAVGGGPAARDPRLDGASRAAGVPGARNGVMAEKRSALIVATSEYEDARLAPLGGPGRDAEALEKRPRRRGDRRVRGPDRSELPLGGAPRDARGVLRRPVAGRPAARQCLGARPEGRRWPAVPRRVGHEARSADVDGDRCELGEPPDGPLPVRADRPVPRLLLRRGVQLGDDPTGRRWRRRVSRTSSPARGMVVITASDAMQYSFEGGQQVGEPPGRRHSRRRWSTGCGPARPTGTRTATSRSTSSSTTSSAGCARPRPRRRRRNRPSIRPVTGSSPRACGRRRSGSCRPRSRSS